MEQQNKLTEEEKAYQALRTQDMQDMPDLWNRIDAGFEEEVTKQKATQKKGRTRQLVLVAAAILMLVIVVPISMHSMRKSQSKQAKNEVAEEVQEADMEAAADDMAEDAADMDSDSAAINQPADSMAADSEMADSAGENMNHASSDVQAEETIDAAASENEETETTNVIPAGYQMITRVVFTQYDAQGKLVQQFDSEDTAETIDKVQYVLEVYQVLDWKAVDMLQSDTSYYLMEYKLQDGTSVAHVYYDGEKAEGKTPADLMQELQDLKK